MTPLSRSHPRAAGEPGRGASKLSLAVLCAAALIAGLGAPARWCGPAVAHAGARTKPASATRLCQTAPSGQCLTAKTTAAAARCEECNAFKGLVSLVKRGQARMTTWNTEHGVLVQVTAVRKGALEDVHGAMEGLRVVLQGKPAKGAEPHICDLCAARMVHLRQVMQEWVMTDTGASLGLTSTDPELVQWLHEDGQAQQQLVSRASSE